MENTQGVKQWTFHISVKLPAAEQYGSMEISPFFTVSADMMSYEEAKAEYDKIISEHIRLANSKYSEAQQVRDGEEPSLNEDKWRRFYAEVKERFGADATNEIVGKIKKQ